jgi:hypothetical protein
MNPPPTAWRWAKARARVQRPETRDQRPETRDQRPESRDQRKRPERGVSISELGKTRRSPTWHGRRQSRDKTRGREEVIGHWSLVKRKKTTEHGHSCPCLSSEVGRGGPPRRLGKNRRIPLRKRRRADRRGLSNAALRRRWTKSALPGDCYTCNNLCVFDPIIHTETQ